MARVVVIGATGHIGTYLVPRLVTAGHEVVAVTRGSSRPYRPASSWAEVEHVVLDRSALEKEGKFGSRIKDLNADIVIDMICFTLKSAQHLVEALDGSVQHFLHTGTIWTHGHATVVPTPEDIAKNPFGEYGTHKAAIESFLLAKARRHGFPATIVHPGHIVGPGWAPLNPAGHFNPGVFTTLARGEQLALPNFGMETVHHVHADDVAQVFMCAISNWAASIGEAFHAVSPAAMTLRGYAEAMAAWFGQKPDLVFEPFEEWAKRQDPDEARATWDHIARSPNCSIDKARTRIGYQPRYTSLEAVEEAVTWLISDGQVAQ
ncbi:NAD-dependent epimerase/dehydratase family protein [Devosia nitrariae]|uniref:Oxidoreductase n=1 Tax=Devosia nitrariae TaxID=2071872 RepID=A0ABQ5WD63_9HYPH|nr:NAD-dependent epimerase/dehydratase family protein [Devosia nitrariae]GLQ57787.1 oxidoreductase [Devosia nitrariae]